MDNSKKYTIKESVIVEDKIFENLRDKRQEYLETSLFASFEVDMVKEEGTLKEWFEDDFGTIRKEVVYGFPVVPAPIVKLIDQLNLKDDNKLKDQIAKLLPDSNETSEVPFIYREWLSLVMTKFLQLCREGLLRKTEWKEHWYSVNVWGLIIDHLLQSIDGMTFHRQVTFPSTSIQWTNFYVEVK